MEIFVVIRHSPSLESIIHDTHAAGTTDANIGIARYVFAMDVFTRHA